MCNTFTCLKVLYGIHKVSCCLGGVKDVYRYIPIFFLHRHNHHFALGEEHFKFVVLPFGLAMGPQVFMKVLAPVLALL